MTDPTFPTILADPNWEYQNFGAKKHGAARGHYTGSGVEYIASIPVQRWARKDTILFLWATLPKLDQAIDVMRAWGFQLVSAIPWVKTVPSKAELAKGIGFWHHGAGELLLECRRGKAKGPVYEKGEEKPDAIVYDNYEDSGPLPTNLPTRVFYSRRAGHSRKPLSLVEWIEAKFPGPRLELFARDTRVGWETWGHETGYHLGPDGVTRYVDAVDSGEVEPIEDGPAELRRKLWTPTPIQVDDRPSEPTVK